MIGYIEGQYIEIEQIPGLKSVYNPSYDGVKLHVRNDWSNFIFKAEEKTLREIEKKYPADIPFKLRNDWVITIPGKGILYLYDAFIESINYSSHLLNPCTVSVVVSHCDQKPHINSLSPYLKDYF